MHSIKDRSALVDTIDTLCQLDAEGNSVVTLLHQLRGTGAKVSWRILYAERLDSTESDTQRDNAKAGKAQAFVELTVSGRVRTNVGESSTGEDCDLLMSAIANALTPMLTLEIAAIADAEALEFANRDRFI